MQRKRCGVKRIMHRTIVNPLPGFFVLCIFDVPERIPDLSP